MDAIHYRNFDAVRAIVNASPVSVLKECLNERNVDGDTVLHVVSDSMASGFGRYMVNMNVRAKGKPILKGRLALDLLKIKHTQDYSHPALKQAIGDYDVRYLLEEAAPMAGLKLQEWVNQKNHLGESSFIPII